MWYVIQVFTGQEESARKLIEQCVDAGSYDELFVPYYRTMRKVQGEWQPQLQALTPGYLMVVTKNVERLEAQLRKVPALTKLLGGGDCSFMPLDREEVAWVEAWTQRGNRVVEPSAGRVERGRVKILSGPLFGMEGNIVRINRRKKQATVRMRFMGRDKDVTVGLEIVGKDS